MQGVIKGGKTTIRTFGTLRTYANREYNTKGVARLLNNAGKLHWEWSADGTGFVTSPLESLIIKDGKWEGKTSNGSVFVADMAENTGIWAFPGDMIAIGYHTGSLYMTTSKKIKVGAVSAEIITNPSDNTRMGIVLNVGTAGEGQSYLLEPEYLEYSKKVLESVDGRYYEYYILTIKTCNNTYSIALV